MPIKNDFDLLQAYCHYTRCGKCKLLRQASNACSCEFKRSPLYWDVDTIRKVLDRFKADREKHIARRLALLKMIENDAEKNFKNLKPEDMIDTFEPQKGKNSVAYWKKELARMRKEAV